MKKKYNFNIRGIVTREEMEDFILEVNNCEFCNNGAFNLNLTEFFFNEDDEMGIAIIHTSYEKGVDINSKLGEMIDCEFCHYEIDYISIMPI